MPRLNKRMHLQLYMVLFLLFILEREIEILMGFNLISMLWFQI